MRRKIKKVISSSYILITLQIFILLLLVSMSFYLGVKVNTMGYEPQIDESYDVSDSIQCNNLTLAETANCLRDYVATFYKYNARSDILMPLEELKEKGGDCYDYSMLYIQMAKDLNFNGEKVGMKIDSNSGHAVAIISDSTGYCLLDQVSEPHCISLGTKNEK